MNDLFCISWANAKPSESMITAIVVVRQVELAALAALSIKSKLCPATIVLSSNFSMLQIRVPHDATSSQAPKTEASFWVPHHAKGTVFPAISYVSTPQVLWWIFQREIIAAYDSLQWVVDLQLQIRNFLICVVILSCDLNISTRSSLTSNQMRT